MKQKKQSTEGKRKEGEVKCRGCETGEGRKNVTNRSIILKRARKEEEKARSKDKREKRQSEEAYLKGGGGETDEKIKEEEVGLRRVSLTISGNVEDETLRRVAGDREEDDKIYTSREEESKENEEREQLTEEAKREKRI